MSVLVASRGGVLARDDDGNVAGLVRAVVVVVVVALLDFVLGTVAGNLRDDDGAAEEALLL